MLTLAVVASRNGGRIPAPVLDRLRDQDLGAVPFDASEHLVWSNEAATVWFGGWQSASADRPSSHHWHVDDEGLTAFAGHLWPRRGGWPTRSPWAAQLAEHLRVKTLTERTDDLAGVYVAAALHQSGRGAVAADPLGFGLIYWGQTPDLTVVSSRAAVAAALLAASSGAEPGRDALGAGWLAYGTRSMGPSTGFTDVTIVPEGSFIEIDPTGDAQLVTPDRPPWLLDGDLAADPGALLAEARAEMTTAIQMGVASGAGATTVGLTGGKDSRLILALLIAEGAAGDVEFQTLGQPSLPDVIVATEIAKRFGLRHIVNPDRRDSVAWRQEVDSAVRADGNADISTREISLRIGVWTASGARNIAKPFLGRLPVANGVQLNGLCGEPLRASWPWVTRLRSKVEAAEFPEFNLKFGSAGILRHEVMDRYRHDTHRLLFDECDSTDTPQDVIDAFYMRHWLRRWFGNEQEFDSQGAVFPLYSLTALRLAFSIGAQSRHAAWIHRELIREACEPLLHIAFDKGGWPEGASGPLIPTPPDHEPTPPPPAITRASDRGSNPSQSAREQQRRLVTGPRRPPTASDRTVFRDHRAKVEAQDVEIMRRVLRYDPSNPVFELLDPVATQDAIDRFPTLPERQKLQMYGAMTAAIWLGGEEIARPRHLASPSL